MRKRRMNLNVYFDDPCVLWDARDDYLYIYAEEDGKFHQKYGGKKYYRSWTGKTQAGYIEEKIDDLMKVGYYDPHRSRQKRKVVGFQSYNPIWGYAPVECGDRWTLSEEDYPIVLTDGKNVAFVSFWRIRYAVLSWQDLFNGENVKSCTYEWFNPDGAKWKKEFQLYNPDNFSGVNAARFIDLREEREICYEAAFEGEPFNLLVDKLNIYHIGDYWFQRDSLGIFVKKWDTDPRDLEGEQLLYGWIAVGGGLFYRRKGLYVEAFMDIERERYFPKYVNEDTGKYIDYEEDEIHVLKWTQMQIEAQVLEFRRKILRKARQDWVFAESNNSTSEEVLFLMKENPHCRVSIKDSLESGNCEPGTKRFIEEWSLQHLLNLEDSIVFEDLLEHTQIEEMLKIFAFRKVIHRAILSSSSEEGVA